MRVFVMRHGEAQSVAPSDSARQLTAKGKEQAYKQAKWLQSLNHSLDKVLVSPYIRAQQTFEQLDLAYEKQLQNKQETWNTLTPYGDASLVADYLRVLYQEGTQNLLIISHLPLVGEIVTELCSKKSPANFYPATIVEIEIDEKLSGKVGKVKYPE